MTVILRDLIYFWSATASIQDFPRGTWDMVIKLCNHVVLNRANIQRPWNITSIKARCILYTQYKLSLNLIHCKHEYQSGGTTTVITYRSIMSWCHAKCHLREYGCSSYMCHNKSQSTLPETASLLCFCLIRMRSSAESARLAASWVAPSQRVMRPTSTPFYHCIPPPNSWWVGDSHKHAHYGDRDSPFSWNKKHESSIIILPSSADHSTLVYHPMQSPRVSQEDGTWHRFWESRQDISSIQYCVTLSTSKIIMQNC